MHWTDHPSAINALAAQYVLGTLQGRARRRFETVMAQRPALRQAVDDWAQQLGRVGSTLAPVAPSAGLWEVLAARTEIAARPAAAAAPSAPLPAATAPAKPIRRAATPTQPERPGLLQRLAQAFDALLKPVPAAALAFGLVAGLALPTVMTTLSPPAAQDTELPESYVGVLATADGRQGLIVASRRHGRVVDLKQVTPVTPPAGQTLFLWTLDAAGTVRPVGPVPHGPFVQAPLSAPAEQVFSTAVELAVSIEPLGAQPLQPGSDFVYRGLCGKVWRVPVAR